MIEFNTTAIALAIIAMGQIVLGFVLYLQGRKNLPNIFFALTAFLIGIWIVIHESRFFYYSAVGYSVPPYWFSRFSLAVAASIFYFFLLFAYSFPQDRLLLRGRLFWIATMACVLTIIASFVPSIVLVSEKFIPGYFSPTYQWGVFYMYGYVPLVYGLFAWGIIYFIYRYIREADPVYKKQFRIVLFGSSIAGMNGIIFALIIPLFTENVPGWIGSTGTLIFTGFATYAIVKYSLFNVKVITTELLTFTIWLVLLTRTILAMNLQEQIFNGLLLITTVILSIWLTRSVLREVQAREQIEKLAKELEFANKELKRLDAAKSEFISIASHQLRTPLSIIKGYISMIREGSYGAVSENVQKTMNKIYFSNERLIKLVTDLLDLSRMESGKLQYEFAEFNMVELADSIVEEFRTPANDRGIAIVWKKTQEALTVWGDSWKLRQVIFNLIDNSLKYTEKGSIAISLQTNNNMVILSVRDTGIGMTPETAHGLFQKFARGKDSSKINSQGLGLGLFIAKKIIDDHQGKLWAESSGEGKGSAFYLELPTAAAVKQKKDFTELMENL